MSSQVQTQRNHVIKDEIINILTARSKYQKTSKELHIFIEGKHQVEFSAEDNNIHIDENRSEN